MVLLLLVAYLLVSGRSNEARSAQLGLAMAVAAEEGQKGEESRHELLFKIINFALLVGALGYLLRRPLAEFFLQRSTAIRKSLDEGRKALEASQDQIHEVEEKLGRMDGEIRAFKESAATEMQAERERLRRAASEEAEKILDAARVQIEVATRAGILELKTFAAQEALRLAEELIGDRLDASSRGRLVSRFVEELVKS
jgi:F-type H+-transporting ATPase subunit b